MYFFLGCSPKLVEMGQQTDLNESIEIDVDSMKALYTSSPIHKNTEESSQCHNGTYAIISKPVAVECIEDERSTFIVEEGMFDTISSDQSLGIVKNQPMTTSKKIPPSVPPKRIVFESFQCINGVLVIGILKSEFF